MKFENKKSITQLAKFLNNPFIGNTEIIAFGINEINRCSEGDIIFVGHPKYLRKAVESAASVIITNDPNIELPNHKAAIISENPFKDFNKLINHEIKNKTTSKKLICGSNSFVHPSVVAGNNVKIGNDCIIHPNVVIYDNVQIGNQTTINANSVVGSPAFYYQKGDEKYSALTTCGEVIIGNNVEIGASCTIDAGVTHQTIIGNGTKMDNQVHIGHDTVIGENCLFAAQVGIAGCNTIEDNVILWGQVGVPSNIKIGKGAILLGQSAPSKDVLPGKVYLGSPAELSRQKFKQLSALKQLPELMKKLNFNAR
tara:strand:- start:3193 stop:4125 length:933 start_codon:yes stop_codon:yes gene_type:complete